MSRLREALRPPRKLIFTGEGRWFVGITLLVGIGAINTGSNLLYLLLGMTLGLIIVSGILSERMIQKLGIRRLPGGDLFAGKPGRVSFELKNDKRWVPSYSVTVQEHESRGTRSMRRLAAGLPADPPKKRKEREAEGDPGGPKALSLRVPARSTVVASTQVVFPRRGLYRYVGLDLATRFPFGFFEKVKPIREPRELIVYPAINAQLQFEGGSDSREGEREQPVEGREGEFFGLKDYREGDDLRDIHWKASARRGQLVRRTRDRRDNESVAIHLYDWIPPCDAPERERQLVREMEEAISATATLCARINEAGQQFSLHTTHHFVAEGTGAAQLQTALRALALLEVRRDAEPPPLTLGAGESQVLVVAPGTPAPIRERFASQVRWQGVE